MKMNQIERAKIGRTPEQCLRDALSEVRGIYSRELEEVARRQGRRYRSLFNEFSAVYEVPDEVFVTSQMFLDTKTEKFRDNDTRVEIPASDAFWARHGYSLLLRVALASGSSSANNGAGI